MSNQLIPRETLLKEVRKLGTSGKACEIIAEKYGAKPSTVKFNISTMKIRQELQMEQEAKEKAAREESRETAEKVMEIMEATVEPTPKEEQTEYASIAEDVELATQTDLTTTFNAPVKTHALRQILKGTVGEYEILDGCIAAMFTDVTIEIENNELNTLITELQELNDVINRRMQL